MRTCRLVRLFFVIFIIVVVNAVRREQSNREQIRRSMRTHTHTHTFTWSYLAVASSFVFVSNKYMIFHTKCTYICSLRQQRDCSACKSLKSSSTSRWARSTTKTRYSTTTTSRTTALTSSKPHSSTATAAAAVTRTLAQLHNSLHNTTHAQYCCHSTRHAMTKPSFYPSNTCSTLLLAKTTWYSKVRLSMFVCHSNTPLILN